MVAMQVGPVRCGIQQNMIKFRAAFGARRRQPLTREHARVTVINQMSFTTGPQTLSTLKAVMGTLGSENLKRRRVRLVGIRTL